MKKLLGSIITGLILLTSAGAFGGCSTSKPEGFAIYLSTDPITPSVTADLKDISLSRQPFIGLEDIVSYNSEVHQIQLTAQSFERVAKLQVPMSGQPFVVCVDKKPVYAGAFMSVISSYRCPGVTIMQPVPGEMSMTLRLQPGFLSESDYWGRDPRGDAVILQSLKEAGKLTTPSQLPGNELPHAAKGYDLFSWLQNGEWNFTLTSGTNRSKTAAEVMSPTDTVTADGWVQVHVVGVDAVSALLGRIQSNESIGWYSGVGGDAQSGADFGFPPADIIAVLDARSQQNGFKLVTITLPE